MRSSRSSKTRVLGAVGRILIGFGVLVLLFVAYQLWGTGLAEARSQRDLRDRFAPVVRSLDGSTTSTTAAAEPVPGDAVALLQIPKIDLDKAVVEGVGVADLKQGPGHYPDTPLPGQPGNAAIAGHRTTYGAPFWHLDELQPGDEIIVTTRQGRFRYEVDHSEVVKPSQTDVLAPTTDATLTLTTCNPRFSASQRLVVKATLKGEPSPAPTTPAKTTTTPKLADGLSGGTSAAWPTFWWGLLASLVALATWLLARRYTRLVYLVGTPAFLVVLFVFYENVARVLPANI